MAALYPCLFPSRDEARSSREGFEKGEAVGVCVCVWGGGGGGNQSGIRAFPFLYVFVLMLFCYQTRGDP